MARAPGPAPARSWTDAAVARQTPTRSSVGLIPNAAVIAVQHLAGTPPRRRGLLRTGSWTSAASGRRASRRSPSRSGPSYAATARAHRSAEDRAPDVQGRRRASSRPGDGVMLRRGAAAEPFVVWGKDEPHPVAASYVRRAALNLTWSWTAACASTNRSSPRHPCSLLAIFYRSDQRRLPRTQPQRTNPGIGRERLQLSPSLQPRTSGEASQS